MPPKAKVINLTDRVRGVALACRNLVGTVIELLQNARGRRQFKIRWDNGEENTYFVNSVDLLHPPAAAAAIVPAANNLALAGQLGAQGNAAAAAQEGGEDEEQADSEADDRDSDRDSEVDRYEYIYKLLAIMTLA
jgi:hypothetical protein